MKVRKLGILGSLLLLLIVFASAARSAEQPQESVLRETAANLSQAFDHFEESQLSLFTDDFFRAVAKEKLVLGLKQNGQALGPLQRTRLCRMTGPYAGEVEFISKSGKRLRADLQLELNPPHRIVSLFVHNIDDGNDSWQALKDDLDRLPGDKSLTVIHWSEGQAKISSDKSPLPNPALFSYQGDEPMAIGSSFKLHLLTTLADQIAKGARKWTDVTALRDDCRSLPSGILQDWPVGSPLTLHTLVTLMISRSDNTAADHLIELLGRQTLEEYQTKLGITHPERNQPFLKTSEHFKLKLVQSAEELEQFANANVAERRSILNRLPPLYPPLSKGGMGGGQSPRTLTKPTMINKVEWFFSTNDLCKLLMQLQQSETRKVVLPILAITRPFDIDDYEWEYLGFKAGAEVGVFNISLLGKLKPTLNPPLARGGKDVGWYALSLTWNRSDDTLKDAAWLRMAERALRLVERRN